MKVMISYASELEDIPKTIGELLGNLNENYIPLVVIDVQDAILYSNEKSITEALESIDHARLQLAKIDNLLLDYVSILAGYAKTKADMYLDIPSEQVNEGTQEVISQNILKEEETDNDKISGDSKS